MPHQVKSFTNKHTERLNSILQVVMVEYSIALLAEQLDLSAELGPGAYPGGMHRMHVHPPSPPLCIPPRPCASPPPQPERLVMRKDEAVGNKKKMQVCLPEHNYN